MNFQKLKLLQFLENMINGYHRNLKDIQKTDIIGILISFIIMKIQDSGKKKICYIQLKWI